MSNPQPQYKFYATLLDAFLWYQASESENAEQEFIDKINRVPITDEKALERMAKGTALNELVDIAIKHGVPQDNSIINYNGFEFNTILVTELARKLQGAIPQVYTQTTIRCNGNDVLVYGYIDYVLANKVIDLKTTSVYELGKYKDSMQMHLYPVALFNEENIVTDEFDFLVTDFKEIYSETYPINLIDSNVRLAITSNALIEFLNAKRDLITDKKIFGLD